MTTTTQYAAYDEEIIWGVGETPEAAVADCTQWVNPEDAEALQASVDTAPMSARLAARVEVAGGNVPFVLRADGVLDLDDDRA